MQAFLAPRARSLLLMVKISLLGYSTASKQLPRRSLISSMS